MYKVEEALARYSKNVFLEYPEGGIIFFVSSMWIECFSVYLK